MLTVISSTSFLYTACALLYQADKRRGQVERVKNSQAVRFGVRGIASLLLVFTLFQVASLQGWELGVPLWLGLFSFVFVAGLFLAAQKPSWHLFSLIGVTALGILSGLGALII